MYEPMSGNMCLGIFPSTLRLLVQPEHVRLASSTFWHFSTVARWKVLPPACAGCCSQLSCCDAVHHFNFPPVHRHVCVVELCGVERMRLTCGSAILCMRWGFDGVTPTWNLQQDAWKSARGKLHPSKCNPWRHFFHLPAWCICPQMNI